MTKEEKFEKALEWLENAAYNAGTIKQTGMTGLAGMVKEQIENAIKYLNDEEVEDGVFGK